MAFSAVIVLFLLGEGLQLHALQMMVHWPQIIVCSLIALIISLLSFKMPQYDLQPKHIYMLLLLDTALWFSLLHASGGAMNPAISYLLVLLSIGALSLSWLHSIILLGVMMVLYTLMMKVQPSVNHAHMFVWHLWGMWVLFLFNALIMMVVIYLLSRKLREQDHSLAAYKEDTVRSEQILMLGTMAANIAHELGTPLSTIAMLVEGEEHEDLKLIQQQVQRCKSTLSLLKVENFTNEEIVSEPIAEFLQKIKQELLLIKPGAKVYLNRDTEICIKTSRLLAQAVLALMNNAVAAANDLVTISNYEKREYIIIDMHHDGKAIDDKLMSKLGLQMVESKNNGLGIGYYLANASIERLGGQLLMINENGGVITRILFNKKDIQA